MLRMGRRDSLPGVVGLANARRSHHLDTEATVGGGWIVEFSFLLPNFRRVFDQKQPRLFGCRGCGSLTGTINRHANERGKGCTRMRACAFSI